MDRFNYLDRRRRAALNQADLAICLVEKRKHEEQARAYAKIMAVLRREEKASLHVQ
ncbi:hypothetical protein [Sphingobium sp. Sx8-8]|uniref:hypothetical protein n=1 Tax=Sphingobium sp. Sx8-8 TaxID=2933617 RepID=UPI001F5A9C78|nr:hypothetical protein [Sphingobium sp. Sx8-8]